MAIALDTSNSSKLAGFPGNTSLTFSYTVGAALSNSILVARPGATIDTAVTRTITDVKYAGSTISQLAGAVFAATGALSKSAGDIWYKVVPASGANNLLVTMSGLTWVIFSGADSWSGVDQTTPFGTAATNTGTGTSATVVVTSAVGDQVVGLLVTEDNNSTDWTTSDTQSWKQDDQTIAGSNAVGSYKAGAATNTTLTWTGSSKTWAVNGAALKPVAAASGSVLQSAGVGTMTSSGASLASVQITAAGSATFTGVGQSSAAATISAAGTGAANFAGQAQAPGALAAAGAATVNFVGTSVNTTQAVLQAAGSSTVIFGGTSNNAGALQASGSATVRFRGASTGGAGVTLWGRRPGQAERRKIIEEEDALLEQFVRERLAPEIIRRARLRQ